MRQHSFRALVTLNAATREDPARFSQTERAPLPANICCRLQPFHHREYFPAVISCDEELQPQPVGHAVVTVELTDGEAEAFRPRPPLHNMGRRRDRPHGTSQGSGRRRVISHQTSPLTAPRRRRQHSQEGHWQPGARALPSVDECTDHR